MFHLFNAIPWGMRFRYCVFTSIVIQSPKIIDDNMHKMFRKYAKIGA